ncbi:MAG: glycine--tRNA ligase [SAR202 cluster bacterium]|nr:glycine--tRNA ligase [Chloroflexota bacterium]MQG38535.1 glycine--tRNA ligase [SAR202 cluster bacterium]|tara:strand:- start:2400 stop:3737 length:1338 start_codon:yes stop_codon:yes gene_type:complete
MSSNKNELNLNEFVSLCKRRGFIYQSGEIYGGVGSTWDYGPMGAELKRNIKNLWWDTFVLKRNDIVGIDTSILTHQDIWKASGHIENFNDPLVECKGCNKRWDQEKIQSETCPECSGELTEPRNFNLMFKTFLGPIESDKNIAYLRPETAQGIFVNFDNVLNSTRKKLPFGIAQIGKAFRNEITTGNFIFRTREFEMMEIEFFVHPEEAKKWHEYWISTCFDWLTSLGVKEEKLKIRAHEPTELSHYSDGTSDIEYLFPWGWGEIQGIANRTDFDLKAHSESSGKKLTYFDDSLQKHITPFVIEPSAGLDRAVMTFMTNAFEEEEIDMGNGKIETRSVLRLNPKLAPVKVAILPLSRKDELSGFSKKVYDTILNSPIISGLIQYDDTQSIGRRYRRQDEIGTPFCVTIDFESLNDNSVTVRDRDSMKQERIEITNVVEYLGNHLN